MDNISDTSSDLDFDGIDSEVEPEVEPKPRPKHRVMSAQEIFNNIDYVPKNVSDLHIVAKLLILEDNEAVLKMIIKGRSTTMRHVARTHRVDLDW